MGLHLKAEVTLAQRSTVTCLDPEVFSFWKLRDTPLHSLHSQSCRTTTLVFCMCNFKRDNELCTNTLHPQKGDITAWQGLVETPGWAEMGQSVPGTERELLEPTSPSQSPEAMAEASKRHSGLALLNAPGLQWQRTQNTHEALRREHVCEESIGSARDTEATVCPDGNFTGGHGQSQGASGQNYTEEREMLPSYSTRRAGPDVRRKKAWMHGRTEQPHRSDVIPDSPCCTQITHVWRPAANAQVTELPGTLSKAGHWGQGEPRGLSTKHILPWEEGF